jgi:hypothetical protein
MDLGPVFLELISILSPAIAFRTEDSRFELCHTADDQLAMG